MKQSIIKSTVQIYRPTLNSPALMTILSMISKPLSETRLLETSILSCQTISVLNMLAIIDLIQPTKHPNMMAILISALIIPFHRSRPSLSINYRMLHLPIRLNTTPVHNSSSMNSNRNIVSIFLQTHSFKTYPRK